MIFLRAQQAMPPPERLSSADVKKKFDELQNTFKTQQNFFQKFKQKHGNKQASHPPHQTTRLTLVERQREVVGFKSRASLSPEQLRMADYRDSMATLNFGTVNTQPS